MAGPDYGVLGATFKICRMLQAISLLACIGMAANFVSEMITQNDTPSTELVGTLSVASLTISGSLERALIVSLDVHRHPLLRHHFDLAH